MQFTPAPRDPENPCNVQAWQSENGTWRLEVERVIFGYRVQLRDARQHQPCAVVDYCAGASTTWVEALVNVLQRILTIVPDFLPEATMQKLFPRATVRPMAMDLVCWHELLRMANLPITGTIDDKADGVDFDHGSASLVALYLRLRFAGVQHPEQVLSLP